MKKLFCNHEVSYVKNTDLSIFGYQFQHFEVHGTFDVITNPSRGPFLIEEDSFKQNPGANEIRWEMEL